jgi:hypothetical protein
MTARPGENWFVRSNGGQGSYPVTPEGWRVVYGFVGGMLVSALVAATLVFWLGNVMRVLVFAVGAAASAAWFIMTARKHTDHSMTVADFMRQDQRGGS